MLHSSTILMIITIIQILVKQFDSITLTVCNHLLSERIFFEMLMIIIQISFVRFQKRLGQNYTPGSVFVRDYTQHGYTFCTSYLTCTLYMASVLYNFTIAMTFNLTGIILPVRYAWHLYVISGICTSCCHSYFINKLKYLRLGLYKMGSLTFSKRHTLSYVILGIYTLYFASTSCLASIHYAWHTNT